MWFPNRSDTNRPVQAQKRARSLKFRIEVEEELYYPSSENKGADQLRGKREADLCLLFSPMQIVGFPMRRLKCCFLINFQSMQENDICCLLLRIMRGWYHKCLFGLTNWFYMINGLASSHNASFSALLRIIYDQSIIINIFKLKFQQLLILSL